MKRLIIMALTAIVLGANAQQKLYITIGGITKTATMVSNSSTEALVAQLQQGDITYEAHDYGNFEKVGALGYTFPENNEQITTVPGDLILYQGSNLCIYYDTNSWNFTRIGKLDNMTQADIKKWVNAGGNNVTVTLSIDNSTGITIKGDANDDGIVNAADIVEVVNYIMGSPSEKFKKKAADANSDETVNAADIVSLVNIILKKES